MKGSGLGKGAGGRTAQRRGEGCDTGTASALVGLRAAPTSAAIALGPWSWYNLAVIRRMVSNNCSSRNESMKPLGQAFGPDPGR